MPKAPGLPRPALSDRLRYNRLVSSSSWLVSCGVPAARASPGQDDFRYAHGRARAWAGNSGMRPTVGRPALPRITQTCAL
jgi:hypothetical protein